MDRSSPAKAIIDILNLRLNCDDVVGTGCWVVTVQFAMRELESLAMVVLLPVKHKNDSVILQSLR